MTVVRYHRVSTEQKSLHRQTTATGEYVAETFPEDVEVRTLADADTGTDTGRDGYERLMEAVESGDVDAVVVKDMSRVARSVRDLMRTVDRVWDAGDEMHFIDDPIEVRQGDDPTQDLVLQILAAVAEFEAKITHQRIREGIAPRQEIEEYHHGPAPLGFNKNDGKLIEAQEYDQVCAVLDMVETGELSKRKAAERLETSRPTINRALDREELYGL